MSGAEQNFRDPTMLTKVTKWLLYAQLVVAVIVIIFRILEYRLVSDATSHLYVFQEQINAVIEAGEAIEARLLIVTVIQIFLFIIGGIFILNWIYRANYNARQLGAEGMDFSPGWAVGWHFIPIVNLWMPYQAMEEIWKTSSNPKSWCNEPVSFILPCWWFFWVANIILGGITSKLIGGLSSSPLVMSAEYIDTFFTTNVFIQINNVVKIILILITLKVIGKIYKMQMQHAKNAKII